MRQKNTIWKVVALIAVITTVIVSSMNANKTIEKTIEVKLNMFGQEMNMEQIDGMYDMMKSVDRFKIARNYYWTTDEAKDSDFVKYTGKFDATVEKYYKLAMDAKNEKK